MADLNVPEAVERANFSKDSPWGDRRLLARDVLALAALAEELVNALDNLTRKVYVVQASDRHLTREGAVDVAETVLQKARDAGIEG